MIDVLDKLRRVPLRLVLAMVYRSAARASIRLEDYIRVHGSDREREDMDDILQRCRDLALGKRRLRAGTERKALARLWEVALSANDEPALRHTSCLLAAATCAYCCEELTDPYEPLEPAVEAVVRDPLFGTERFRREVDTLLSLRSCAEPIDPNETGPLCPLWDAERDG